MLGDGQTESRAAGFARARRIHAVEAFKDALERGGRNADALIDHTDGDLAALMPYADRHGGVHRGIVDGILH